MEPSFGQPAYCRACLYPLAGLTEEKCPECGSPFDRQDPRSYLRHPRRATWRRRLRRLAIVAAVLALVVAVAPRGYVHCTLTLTSPTGLSTTYTRIEIIGPSWLGGYGGWTRVADLSRPGWNESRVTYALAAQRKEVTLRGLTSDGSVRASGTSARGGTSTINDVTVSTANAKRIVRMLGQDLATPGDGYGVSLSDQPAITITGDTIMIPAIPAPPP